ncbi:MAG: hypothetical protein HY867_10355 [Chloroflexi bacterium]|nr:hypothetical protein [Chloroflexota bacterium]
MLFTLTSVTDYLGFSISLWLAFYLFARGFPSRITMRTVVVLLALAVFFLSASINLHLRVPGATAIRSSMLVIALATWHDLSNRLLPQEAQKRTRWLVQLFYLVGLIVVLLLFWTHSFVGENENILYVGRMNLGPIYALFGVYQILVSLAIIRGFRLGVKFGVGEQNRLFFIASILAISTVAYGIFALALAPPMPRIVQDLLILSSVILMGIAVARYQVFIERRTTIEDFPVSILAVFSLSAVFAFLAWIWSRSAVIVNLITALAILTHAIYDLAREFVDRKRYQSETDIRHQLRKLKDHDEEDTFQERLTTGLALLCKVINASGGFIAIKTDNRFIVLTSNRSLPAGSEIPADAVGAEIQQPAGTLRNEIDWLAPALENETPMAVIGIGPSKSNNEYSNEDIDMLAEVADRVGSIVHLHNDRVARPSQVTDGARALDAESDQLLSALISSPDPEFVKTVEEALRSLSDIIKLGDSPLANYLRISEGTQIERGRAMRDQLIRAIEMLKPDAPRPPEPLPREWYNYVVLYDAYVKDVPNREIMARMYVSEGTFNRSRRNALRGVAKYLLEQSKRK